MEHISNLCARPSATLENLPGLIYFHDCCHSSEQMPGDNNDQKEHAPRLAFFLNSGIAQSVTVFLWANILVFPRWFDYKNKVVDKDRKIEKDIYGLAVAGDGDGRWKMEHTCLRDIEGYNRYYVGIVDTLCTMAIPLAVMVVTTILMMRQLRAVKSSLAISMIQRPTRI